MTSHTRASVAAMAALLLITLSACSQNNAPDGAATPIVASSSPAATGPRLVALGDSSTTGAGDSEGTGWVQRYADLLEKDTRQSIEVVNRATAGLPSESLASQVESSQPLRAEIASAAYVVVGVGGADLNPGDEAWGAGTCSGPPCYSDILASYEANIARIAKAIAELRAGKPTVLRAITTPNVLTGAESVIPPFLVPTATPLGVFLARSNRDSTCKALRAHGGECIDVLTAFNGPDGTQNPYTGGWLNLANCCYASSRGQQRMAELLVATGVEPAVLAATPGVPVALNNLDADAVPF